MNESYIINNSDTKENYKSMFKLSPHQKKSYPKAYHLGKNLNMDEH